MRGYDLRSVGRYWIIYGPNGRRASGLFTDPNLGEARRESLEQKAKLERSRKMRPCLCCQTVFASEGIHNRLCGTCRGNRADFQMAG